MFSGLLVCADCKHNLYFHFNQGNPEIKYFNCCNYIGNRGTCNSAHYIRADFLEQVVLAEVRRLTQFASQYEDDFINAVMEHSQETIQQECVTKQKELNTLLARDKELDFIFERLYEDNVSGKITDERFSKMLRKYEDAQGELAVRVKVRKTDLAQNTDKSMTTSCLIPTVRKYTRAKKLTQRLLYELVDRIEVYNAEKIDCVHHQMLTIHYNCIGSIEILDKEKLAKPSIVMTTRKGVTVSYAPKEKSKEKAECSL